MLQGGSAEGACAAGFGICCVNRESQRVSQLSKISLEELKYGACATRML